MTGTENIREGMRVVGEGDRAMGTVERLQGDGFHVAGQHYTRADIARVAGGTVYLRGGGAAAGGGTRDASEREVRVPIVEEHLNVEKREAELGEVQVRKTVTEEEQTVPVTLQREEVKVQERDVAERPLRADDDAFNEGTIRVPVRGEEAVVAKKAVVTGEVVINKERTTREEQVTETVRKQRVEADEQYRRARGDLEREHGRAGGGGRTFEQAEPHYRTGFEAAHDERYAGREFEAVEPDLQAQHAARGTGDDWATLRREVREGWGRARKG